MPQRLNNMESPLPPRMNFHALGLPGLDDSRLRRLQHFASSFADVGYITGDHLQKIMVENGTAGHTGHEAVRTIVTISMVEVRVAEAEEDAERRGRAVLAMRLDVLLFAQKLHREMFVGRRTEGLDRRNGH